MNDQNVRESVCDVTKFSIREMTGCGKEIRTMDNGAASMEEVAGKVVSYLYDTLVHG